MASSPRANSWSSPRRPVRSSRMKVRSYHEESSSDDNAQPGGGMSLSLRPRSFHRKPTSYREDSTDGGSDGLMDDGDSNAVESLEAPIHAPPPAPSQVRSGRNSEGRRSRKVNTRSQAKRSNRQREGRWEVGRPLHKRQKVDTVETTIVPSGPIPPWQTIPFHILFDIFHYASYPLLDEGRFTRNYSVQWLVNMALLCRAFHEPALSALYYSPPLLPPSKAHGLLNLLSTPQETLSTNYANKIKELHVDVEVLLVYKSGPTLGYFDLPRLVERTPLVKILRLYNTDDSDIGYGEWQPPQSRWGYTDALFSSMQSSSIRLRSWEWNSRFMHTEEPTSLMSKSHDSPVFRRVQALKLMHLIDIMGIDDIRTEKGPGLAHALEQLPELTRLEFFECSAINDFLFPELPKNLTHLTITNCDAVDSENLSSFLASGGQNLRELSLNHNRHMNLSFMTGLAESCCNLERFKMDLSIHDRSPFRNVRLCFPELLSLSEVPTWPAALQDIELIHLSKWDDAAAEVFFTSLIDAAPRLRHLRKLVINAILMIGWRDRATFRGKWVRNLESVFLRRSAPPNPSMPAVPRTPPQSEQPTQVGDTAGLDLAQYESLNGDLSSLFKRKSARLAQRKLSETEDNDDSSAQAQTPNEGDTGQRPRFVQGMCDVVQVRIDNQRPSDTQFNENDFLDSEASGDEDWV